MESGELDILQDTFLTSERQVFMDYSEIPYATFPQTLFTLKNSGIKFDGNLESIKDYVVGITRGFSYGESFDAAIKNGLFVYEESSDINNLFTKLMNNRVDLIADAIYTGRDTIIKMGKENEIIVLEPFFDNLFSYVTFSKANNLEPLRDEYDKTIKTLIENGNMKEIYDKYEMGDMLEIMIKEIK
jgi:polar amino acid transport system substrate-binding protein